MTPWEATTDHELSDGAYRLLGALCSYRRNKQSDELHGWLFVGLETLADDLGLSVGGVRYRMEKLVERGWVEKWPRREVQPDFRGHPRALAYYVRWERGEKSPLMREKDKEEAVDEIREMLAERRS